MILDKEKLDIFVCLCHSCACWYSDKKHCLSIHGLVFQADYRGWLLLLAARLLLAVFLRTDHLPPSKTSSINGYKYILPYFLVQPPSS